MVRQMILDCLRYWVINYRVDGFRFDLASILGRNEDATPMSNPPLLQSLAYDPILWNVDLIAEAWDAAGLYQVGAFPSWNRWTEWNGKYRDDIRSFLKGDDGYAMAAAQRIMGSPDLYPPEKRGENASVNFLTCHDGFTLFDLYSYNMKHNEANGWDNTDGANDNRSWNCGYEGPTNNNVIMELRYRMIKNACAILLCSRGTPMFLSGDEFGNTKYGNNNSYCQDNEISWLDWNLLDKNRELFEFFKFMTAFRRAHSVIRGNTALCSLGFPSMSYHGAHPWDTHYTWDTKVIGVMFAGKKRSSPADTDQYTYLDKNSEEKADDDIVYIAVNAFWERQQLTLPALNSDKYWIPAVDTSRGDMTVIAEKEVLTQNIYVLGPRSVAIFLVNDK